MAACREADAIAFWRALHTLARVCQLRAPGARSTFLRCNISDVTPALQVDLLDSAAAPIKQGEREGPEEVRSQIAVRAPDSDMNITRCPDPRSSPRTRLRPSRAHPDISEARMQGEPNGVRVGTGGGSGRYGLPADGQCTGTTTAFARPAMAQRFCDATLNHPEPRTYAAVAGPAAAHYLTCKCTQSCRACL